MLKTTGLFHPWLVGKSIPQTSQDAETESAITIQDTAVAMFRPTLSHLIRRSFCFYLLLFFKYARFTFQIPYTCLGYSY